MESFLDYDDISLIYSSEDHKENTAEDDIEDEDKIVVVTDKNEEITNEILINGDEKGQTNAEFSDWGKMYFAERGRWLRSRCEV